MFSGFYQCGSVIIKDGWTLSLVALAHFIPFKDVLGSETFRECICPKTLSFSFLSGCVNISTVSDSLTLSHQNFSQHSLDGLKTKLNALNLWKTLIPDSHCRFYWYFLLRSTKSCFVKYNWIKISTAFIPSEHLCPIWVLGEMLGPGLSILPVLGFTIISQ